VQKRRYLAVAAALAVTSPLALFAASPAVAEPAPVAAEEKKGHQELLDAVTEARAVYAEALRARNEAADKVAALEKGDHPLVVAVTEARKAAEEARTALDAAVERVAQAGTALTEAQDEAGKAAAEKELADAELALEGARETHRAAAGEAKQAKKALDDALDPVKEELRLAKKAEREALKALEAAEKALADAEECKPSKKLKAKAIGLPEQLAAGERATFTFRMSNGTRHTLDIRPLSLVVIDSGGDQDDLEVEWKDGDGWKALETAESPDVTFEDVEPGERVDIRMRLTLDKDAEKGHALAAFAVDPAEDSVPCLYGPMKTYDLQVLPAGGAPTPSPSGPGDPSASPSAGPSPSASASPSGTTTASPSTTPGATPQGGTTGGSLAATGSGATPVALAAASALVLGAGAVAVSRRRKAGARS
jgi:colicin import membrane protein